LEYRVRKLSIRSRVLAGSTIMTVGLIGAVNTAASATPGAVGRNADDNIAVIHAAAAPLGNYITSSHVPGAAVDGNAGNRFVFWYNPDTFYLEEAWYTAATNRWQGASAMPRMGRLASEPTVAAGYSTSGADGYGYQFVFWEGTSGSLIEAYWDGSWHGPIDLGMGPVYAPSATIDMATGVVTVVWTKPPTYKIMYAYTVDGNSPSHQTWSGPHYTGWGSADTQVTAADGDAGAVQVFWWGNDGYLQHGSMEAAGGPTFGPAQINSGKLGSVPTATGSIPIGEGGPVYHVFWSGSGNHGLWTLAWHAEVGDPGGVATAPYEIPGMRPLGSAPSCALWQGTDGNWYCYWAGESSPHDLWQASFVGGVSSGPTNLGYAPIEPP
jgi:hypothetical protein